jgi:hypothetical protein
MGAYGLLRGGGSTASTIGSIGQMAGGVMMMIPGMQPFGAALSVLSSIVPGLFGEGPKIPPQPPLAYGMGSFYATGGRTYTNGSDALNGGTGLDGAPLGAAVMNYFRSAGLSPVAGKLIGGELASGVDHQRSGNGWSDRPFTQIGLVGPSGGLERLTYNDSSRGPQAAGEMLVAQVVRANVLRGGVSGAGAGLTAGLKTIDPTTQADLDNVIAMGTAYDRLGKAANPVKDAIDNLSGSFDDLTGFATKAGLSLEPVTAELAKQTRRTAQDFIDSMLDPLAVQMRALQDDRESALASAEYIRKNVEGVFVDLDKIVDFYGKKRLALEDQFYGGAITNLQALIEQLSTGGLSNLSPTSQLAALKGDYAATLSAARTGDAEAITHLAGDASNYINAGRQYFASSQAFEDLRRQIMADLLEVQSQLGGGGSFGGGAGRQQRRHPGLARPRRAPAGDRRGAEPADRRHVAQVLAGDGHAAARRHQPVTGDAQCDLSHRHARAGGQPRRADPRPVRDRCRCRRRRHPVLARPRHPAAGGRDRSGGRDRAAGTAASGRLRRLPGRVRGVLPRSAADDLPGGLARPLLGAG